MKKTHLVPVFFFILVILCCGNAVSRVYAGQPGSTSGEPPLQTAVQSPETFFGFRMGTDRQLIDWNQICRYLRELDKVSDRVTVIELGKTTLDKPFLLAIFSSPANMINLERLKAIQQQLANPYDLPADKAKALIAEGKTVVLLSLNIHSTEIASSQESVELAYELAARNDEKTLRILDNLVLLMIPSLNPDGQQMVVDWYKKHLGTAHEGCDLPWLYHHYAGHDNNRDWYMFNLQESRLTAPVLYREWFPEIIYDQHQMGSAGPRLFMPPYSDPVNPNTPSLLMAEVNMLGKHVVADLHEQGFKGVVTGMRFNAFFEGTMSKTPLWHNMVGILSEMASARLATPLYFARGSLGPYDASIPQYSRVTDFLDPWQGGWWRLRDIIEYEKAATYSILDLAVTYKEKFKTNFYEMNRQAIEKGRSEAPYAFIIPAQQHDPNAAQVMLDILRYNGADIYSSKSGFTYEGHDYPAGTYVVPLAQSCRSCIKDLLEPQVYPDLMMYPGGPPEPPYDVTGWTLQLQMGVNIVEVNRPLDFETVITRDSSFGPVGMIATDATDLKASAVPAGNYLFECRWNNSFAIVNELLKNNYPVHRSREAFAAGDKQEKFPAGTFIVPAGTGAGSKLETLAKEFALPVYGIYGQVEVAKTLLELPRVGLYHSYTASMDEGWTRLVLDNHRFLYSHIYNPDIKKGKLYPKYNVIIIPDLSIDELMEGKTHWNGEVFLGTAEKPKEYRGGIGEEGTKALVEFVTAGGTLLCLNQACEFAVEKMKVPAVNMLKGVKSNDFYSPGSLLDVEIDTTHPLAFGMLGRGVIRMVDSPAFRLRPHIQESRAVVYYTGKNPLLSGWLIGGEKLQGQTALADIPIAKGRVILFGFGVQSRAQTLGTFKLLFNAIYY